MDCCCSNASTSTNVVLNIDTYGRNNNVFIYHQRGSENIPPDRIRSCTHKRWWEVVSWSRTDNTETTRTTKTMIYNALYRKPWFTTHYTENRDVQHTTQKTVMYNTLHRKPWCTTHYTKKSDSHNKLGFLSLHRALYFIDTLSN